MLIEDADTECQDLRNHLVDLQIIKLIIV
jgi:hypothetical protein